MPLSEIKREKIILGAGIAGLGAYYADNSADIYEASDRAGGICRGFWIDDFYFDQAVHFSFSKDRLVRALFDKTEQFYHHPVPYSWYKETWLRHPAQNNLFSFPIPFRIDAIKGFIERQGRENARNFKEWLIGGYGEFLYQKLFRLYNEKYWQTDLEKMGVAWIGNRLYLPEIDELLYGAFTDETPNVYYASEMRYPKENGYYSFFSDISKLAETNRKLHFNKKAVRIDTHNKIITFADKTTAAYDALYASAPLPEVLKMLDHVPEQITEMSKRLEHTGVVLVSIGLCSKAFEKFWFYIYDTDIMAARAYMPSTKSPNNAPESCSSIQFEIYFNSKAQAPDKQAAIDNCIYALDKMGIAPKENVLFADYRIMPYGNVTMLQSTENEITHIREWLKKVGITPIGRFGEWNYLWSDQAFLSGYHAMNR